MVVYFTMPYIFRRANLVKCQETENFQQEYNLRKCSFQSNLMKVVLWACPRYGFVSLNLNKLFFLTGVRITKIVHVLTCLKNVFLSIKKVFLIE